MNRERFLIFGLPTLLFGLFALWSSIGFVIALQAAARYNNAPGCIVSVIPRGSASPCREEIANVLDHWVEGGLEEFAYTYHLRVSTTDGTIRNIQLSSNAPLSADAPPWWDHIKDVTQVRLQWFEDKGVRVKVDDQAVRTSDNPGFQVEQNLAGSVILWIATLFFGFLSLLNWRR